MFMFHVSTTDRDLHGVCFWCSQFYCGQLCIAHLVLVHRLVDSYILVPFDFFHAYLHSCSYLCFHPPCIVESQNCYISYSRPHSAFSFRLLLNLCCWNKCYVERLCTSARAVRRVPFCVATWYSVVHIIVSFPSTSRYMTTLSYQTCIYYCCRNCCCTVCNRDQVIVYDTYHSRIYWCTSKLHVS